VVVALGIYMTGARIDAALLSDTGAIDARAADELGDIIRFAAGDGAVAPTRMAVAHPGWWSPWDVDRLLRDVRAADLAVDRYFTAGEAAARWTRHTEGRPPDGVAMVRDLTPGQAHDTLLRVDGSAIDIVGAFDGRRCIPDVVSTVTVGVPGSPWEHAVALGAALAVLG